MSSIDASTLFAVKDLVAVITGGGTGSLTTLPLHCRYS